MRACPEERGKKKKNGCNPTAKPSLETGSDDYALGCAVEMTVRGQPWKTQKQRFPHSRSAYCFQITQGHSNRAREGGIFIELAHGETLWLTSHGGLLYVLDTDQGVVRRLESDGTLKTVVGTRFQGHGGPAEAASLSCADGAVFGADDRSRHAARPFCAVLRHSVDDFDGGRKPVLLVEMSDSS
jgi:hypothetical protein